MRWDGWNCRADVPFMNQVRRLVDRRLEGRTLVAEASNSQNFALDYCNEGIVLKDGAIIYRGSLDDCAALAKEAQAARKERSLSRHLRQHSDVEEDLQGTMDDLLEAPIFDGPQAPRAESDSAATCSGGWLTDDYSETASSGSYCQRDCQARTANESGKRSDGCLGVFVEPLLFIAIFMSFRLFGSQASLQPDYINPVLWMAIGFVGFFMFSEVALKALGGVKKSTKLTYYSRIRPIDYLLGSAVLDTQVFSLLLLAFIFSSFVYEWKPIVEEPGLAVFYFIMLSLLAFGVGLVTLIIGHRLPFVASIARTAVRRLLLFTSCIFFSISTIPNIFRGWILWNPLAHGIELLRHSFNSDYPIPGVSAVYLIGSTFFLLGLGFFIYGNNETLLLADEE